MYMYDVENVYLCCVCFDCVGICMLSGLHIAHMMV
jgi:hypothetical protein